MYFGWRFIFLSSSANQKSGKTLSLTLDIFIRIFHEILARRYNICQCQSHVQRYVDIDLDKHTYVIKMHVFTQIWHNYFQRLFILFTLIFVMYSVNGRRLIEVRSHSRHWIGSKRVWPAGDSREVGCRSRKSNDSTSTLCEKYSVATLGPLPLPHSPFCAPTLAVLLHSPTKVHKTKFNQSKKYT